MTPPHVGPRSDSRARLLAVLIGLSVLIVFGRVATHEFTNWDDPQTIAENPAFRPPTWSGVMGYWRLLEPVDAQSGHVIRHAYGLWVPLTYTVWGALAAVAQVPDPGAPGGVGLNPYVFHAASVAMHAVSAVLVFYLLRRVLRAGDGPAVAGALLFAVHPVQVEAVAWASGMKDLLAGLLSLASLLLYARHADGARSTQRRRVDWWASTACFAAALLAKPSAVTLPLLAGALDALLLRPGGSNWRRTMVAITPWLMMSLLAGGIAKLAQPAAGLTPAPIPIRPLIAADALAFYLGKVFVPVGMTVDYGRTPSAVVQSGQIWWTWLAPAGAVAVAGWWAFKRQQRAPLAAFVVFAAAPAAVLGLAPFLFQFYSTTADHYLYVAMLGPAVAATWLLARAGRVGRVVAGVALVALALLSIRQAGVWRDSETLFRHAAAVNPRSFAAHNNLGTLASQQGRYADAERHFRTAVQLAPTGLQAMKNLREVLIVQDRPAEALEWLRAETRLRQSLPYLAAGPYWNDPNHLGVLLLLRGRLEAAERHFDLLLQLDPGNGQAQLLRRLAGGLRAGEPTAPTTGATQPG